jgi:hypothetical protein
VTSDQLVEEFKEEFRRRRFVAGLVIAFARFFRALGTPERRYDTFDAFLADHSQQETARGGATANTLIVAVPGENRTVSIRPFYNEAEQLFRVEHKRFDYPNCAPHATQAWRDYRRWLDILAGFSERDLISIEEAVKGWVLSELPSHEVDASSIEPLEQRFVLALQGFDLARQRGEPSGAAFQGMVYAYIRADAPHLHLDISKVGAGSKRLSRVGDIDGWEGERLILSAEVKYRTVDEDAARNLEPFIGEVTNRKAMGIVVARDFGPEAATDLEGSGVHALDMSDLTRIVSLWDPLKQRAAINAFSYYLHHIQCNSALIRRWKSFLANLETPWRGNS